MTHTGRVADATGLLPSGEPKVSPPDGAAIPHAARVSAEDPLVAYEAAYQRAHGERPPFRISYERGWYVFRSRNSSWVMDRKRRADLVAMTKRLHEFPARTPLSATEGQASRDQSRTDPQA